MLTIKDATLGRVRYGGEHEVKLDISYGPMSYNHFKLDLDEEGVNRVLEAIRAEAGRMLGVIDYEKPEPIEEVPAPLAFLEEAAPLSNVASPPDDTRTATERNDEPVF